MNQPVADNQTGLGENWEQAAKHPSASPGATLGDSLKSPLTGAAQSIWSLVLGTFSGPDHESAARQMLMNLPAVAPQAGGARVHTTSKGSMVVYGRYQSRDDPNAKADQERLKSITLQGRPVFNRVILTRLDLRSQSNLHPHDLLSARRAHPKVDPLYTLDVALWMSNPDSNARDRLTYDDVQRKAEAYAAQLRARGEEAYFYHDDEHQRSTVTVGLFDRRAINTRSGLFSDDVVNVMKRFPERLVNGEPLIELKNPKRPQLGGTPQQPKLSLVPSL